MVFYQGTEKGARERSEVFLIVLLLRVMYSAKSWRQLAGEVDGDPDSVAFRKG